MDGLEGLHRRLSEVEDSQAAWPVLPPRGPRAVSSTLDEERWKQRMVEADALRQRGIDAPDPSPFKDADQNRLMAGREYILQALKDAMGERHKRSDWVVYERQAVANAANEWAKAHGIRFVTVADVERMEQQAIGRVDYASKLALYVAEAVTVPSGRSAS